jgi:osmotically-inducible protein OsmY
MVVLPGTRSLGQTLDDTKLQAQLKTKLADIEGVAAAHRINTEVRQGHVLLTGFVGHDGQRTQAGSIARGINGVKAVHNKISVAH